MRGSLLDYNGSSQNGDTGLPIPPGERTLRIIVLSVLLGGCLGPERIDAAKDRDGDDYQAWQIGGEDCDDGDPAVHPGANEICADGVDNDCDGAIDDDGIGALTWYPDLDGDGFGADEPVTACAQPDSHVEDLDGGVDCNVDQDCDGADDYDQDGDGYRAEAETDDGTDCDDLVAEVNPGEEEVCGNHRDDDCDGGPNGCELRGSFHYSTTRHAVIDLSDLTSPGRQLSIGDLNGDDSPDVAIGGYGQPVYMFYGPMSGTVPSSAAIAVLNHPTDEARFVSFDISGDYDGDGKADLVAGRHESNSSDGDFFLWDSPISGFLTKDDATSNYIGPDRSVVHSGRFAFTLRSVGDLDGDQKDELVVGQEGGAPFSYCYLYHGPLPDSGPAADLADVIISDTIGDQRICESMAKAPDLTGDGQPDFVVGAQGETGYGAGSANVVSGAVADDFEIADSAARIIATNNDELAGYIVATGELSGDTDQDIAIAAPGSNDWTGLVYVAFGPFSGTSSLADAEMTLAPEQANQDWDLGDTLAVGDLNGDATDDLVFGSADAPTGPDQIGIVYVYYGPLESGSQGVYQADVRILGTAGADHPRSLETADIDQDGFDDIILATGSSALILFGSGA